MRSVPCSQCSSRTSCATGRTHLRTSYAFTGLAAPFVWIAVFNSLGLYRLMHLQAWDEFRRIIAGCTAGTAAIAMAAFWTKSNMSRQWVAVA